MWYLQCPCHCLGKGTWCHFDTVFSVGPKADPVACHCGAERRLWYHCRGFGSADVCWFSLASTPHVSIPGGGGRHGRAIQRGLPRGGTGRDALEGEGPRRRPFHWTRGRGGGVLSGDAKCVGAVGHRRSSRRPVPPPPPAPVGPCSDGGAAAGALLVGWPDGEGPPSQRTTGTPRAAVSGLCPVPPPPAPRHAPGQRHGSLGRPTPGVVKQDKSSGGSVDTTNTRSGPQSVRMSSGERGQ